MTRTIAAIVLLSLSALGPVDAADDGLSGDAISGDALSIVEQAFTVAEANAVRAREYVFHEHVEVRRFGKRGKADEHQSWTFDVTLLDSSEHRRLIARNDQPLDAQAAANEQRKLDKQLKALEKETPKRRAKRLAKVEKGREEAADFLKEITRAFDFTRIGEEEIDGVATHVIAVEPKAGYKPSSRETKVLTKVRGTLWIARDGHAWVKADLETLGNITWALVFKLREGARFGFTQRRLASGVWVMDSWYARLRAKAALVFKVDRAYTARYSNFRRFTTDTSIEFGEPVGW